jgi:hypothetical protein
MPATGSASGPVAGHLGLVVHRRGGSTSPDAYWFCNPSDDLSPTFSVTPDGQPLQHLDDDERSALLGSGGRRYSVVEVTGSGALSAEQIDGLAAIYAEGHDHYGWPLTVVGQPGEPGLMGHGCGGLLFAAHADCPGSQVLASFDAVLRAAESLVEPEPAAGGANLQGVADDEHGVDEKDDTGTDETEERATGVPDSPPIRTPNVRLTLANEAAWGRRWLPG